VGGLGASFLFRRARSSWLLLACVAVTVLLATFAALALADAQRADQMHDALSNRDVIGQAKGILMERHGVTATAAFGVLSRVSQAENTKLAEIARRFAGAEHMFFIGRVRGWPVAREGAQKLKEISYVHAEAYQAGELKHGPLALIQPDMPSVVVIPSDDLIAKNISTIEQIKARGGPVIAVTSADIPEGLADAVIRVPKAEPELEPILFNIPLQLLAYHAAAKLGRDIDKPRNLAKSVTVE